MRVEWPTAAGPYAAGIGSRMEPCKKRLSESRPRDPSSALMARNSLRDRRQSEQERHRIGGKHRTGKGSEARGIQCQQNRWCL